MIVHMDKSIVNGVKVYSVFKNAILVEQFLDEHQALELYHNLCEIAKEYLKSFKKKKQSSLDFYRENLSAIVSGKGEFKTETEIYEQAKAIHKEELQTTAFDMKQLIYVMDYQNFDDYYNEKFGGKNEQ